MRRLFDEGSFAGAFKAGDSRRFDIDLKNDRAKVLAAAMATAAGALSTYGPINTTRIKGRPCISVSDYSQTLILRITGRYLARRFRIETPNRDRIVKAVIESIGESTPMHIIRRDISSFYESLSIDRVKQRLTNEVLLPPGIKKYISCYFDTFCHGKPIGIPRGVSLSPILAELFMEDFDKRIRTLPGVHRYFRYSDDILVFSHENPDSIVKEMEARLPHGMKFNQEKSSISEIKNKKKVATKEVSFEYLGYKYTFSDYCGSKEARRVDVGISDRKLSKLRTRLICALNAFRKSGNFYLLLDRIKFISGNFLVYRKGVSSIRTSKFVRSGIYYNYKLCGSYTAGETTPCDVSQLKNLDGFYRSLIRKNNWGKSFDPTQLVMLLRISFAAGFSHKLTMKFDAGRVQEIKRIWKNV